MTSSGRTNSTSFYIIIYICVMLQRTGALTYVGCLVEDGLKLVRLNCDGNNGLQIHSAWLGRSSSIDCGQPQTSPSDCTQNQISQTEEFRGRCNTYRTCSHHLSYVDLDQCRGQINDGRNYVFVQYECRSRSDATGQPMNFVDPLRTSSDATSAVQVTLQSRDYAQNTLFNNAICRIDLAAYVKVRIDLYDLSHNLSADGDVPYCIHVGWKQVCAEKGQSLDIMEIAAVASSQSTTIEFKREGQASAAFGARFWIILSALNERTGAYAEGMSIVCTDTEASGGDSGQPTASSNPTTTTTITTTTTNKNDINSTLEIRSSSGEDDDDDTDNTKFAVLIGAIPAALIILIAIIAITVSCIRRKRQLVNRLAYMQHATIKSAMKHGAQCNRSSSPSPDDDPRYVYTRYQPDGDSLKSGSPVEPYQIGGATFDESTDCIYSNIPDSPNGVITPYQMCQPQPFTTYATETISPYGSSRPSPPTFSTFAPVDSTHHTYDTQISVPTSPTDSATYQTIPGAYDPHLADQDEIYQTQIIPALPPDNSYAYTGETFMNKILPAHAAATSANHNVSDTAVRHSRANFIRSLENLYAKPNKPSRADAEAGEAHAHGPRAVRRLDSETEVVENDLYRYNASIGHI